MTSSRRDAAVEQRSADHAAPCAPPWPAGDDGDQGQPWDRQGDLQVAMMHWSYVVPPPVDMEHYEKIQHGSMNRWLHIAESQNQAQIDSIHAGIRLSDAQITQAATGQRMAFALTGASMIAAMVFFALHNWVGGGVFTSFPAMQAIRMFLVIPLGNRRSDVMLPGPRTAEPLDRRD